MGLIEEIMDSFTKDLYISPMYDRNKEKYGDNENQCHCCKKPIKDIENSYWIHMNEGGLVLHNSINEANCFELTNNNSMGCFPIGNECAKKIGKEFIFKYV